MHWAPRLWLHGWVWEAFAAMRKPVHGAKRLPEQMYAISNYPFNRNQRIEK
ncbi:hypothetical protein [Xylophilus sp. ASV27]|uniref:hypothetical protein n=1 Tax=Xylophilus sp. ASV27 TaxID=2795129 RepID=UPI0018ED8EF6|nr:hypothetical protein [Xylophilus sp. ASV27]